MPCLGPDKTTDPAQILAVLADFGLRKIFVEGGGLTVSEFLNADLLDRLHVMVAPMIIGSGRPAFSLPEISHLGSALRPRAQMVNLGSDMLFDLDFTANNDKQHPGQAGDQHHQPVPHTQRHPLLRWQSRKWPQ